MQSQEYELVDFMCNKFMQVIGKGDKKGMQALKDIKGEREDKAEGEGDQRALQKKSLKAQRRAAREEEIAAQQQYSDMLNNEIHMKFAQLDETLNEYFIDNFEVDNNDNNSRRSNKNDQGGYHSDDRGYESDNRGYNNRSSDNSNYQSESEDPRGFSNPGFDPSFDYGQLKEDYDAREELNEELFKWQ